MENDKELFDIFVSDTITILENIENLLLEAEQSDYTPKIVDEIFRGMHSMKGSAATMGIDSMAKLSHAMEDIFDHIRKKGMDNIDKSWLTSMLLVCKDFLEIELDKISKGKEPDGDPDELAGEIRKHLEFMKNYETLPENTIVQPELVRNESNAGNEFFDKFRTYQARVFFTKDSGMPNVRALILVQRIGECMMIREHVPYELTNEKSEEIIIKKGFQIIFDSELDIDAVRNLIESNALCLDKCEISIISSDGMAVNQNIQEKTEQAAEKKEKAPEAKIKTGMININVAKLDRLMDITSEIIITQALLIQNPDLKGLELQNFEKVARQFIKITNELQDTVMSLRMLPISQVFTKMKRIVRDVSEKLGKKVELKIVGETTEVDKNIIETISDPLMHIIRNSIDHGIEMPEARKIKGKLESGTVVLEAKHIGSEVWILITDDGGGLNKEKIYKKALEHGLTEKSMEELKENEIFNYIFAPGFSTKEETTEFSGRGVGMDVVYKNIEKLHGTCVIERSSGEGTLIVLKIPLTLAIIDGMTIKVGETQYTVPVESIKEILALKKENIIRSTDGTEIIKIRNRYHSLVKLYERFKIKTKVQELTEGMALIVQTNNADICIFADELIGEQQVVVKPLPDYIKKIKGVAGCTLLGDGTISMILDTEKLI